MNRRRKKRQQSDPFAAVKHKLQQADFAKVFHHLKAQIEALFLRLPPLHRKLLMILVPVVVILLLIPTREQSAQPAPEATSSRMEVAINTQSLSTREQANTPAKTEEERWQNYTIQQGDTLSKVFRNQGFSMADLNALVRIEGDDKPLSRLKTGQLVRFKRTADGELDIIQLDSAQGAVMFFRLSDGGFGRSK
ncbi:LysM-like peptidoglycan-binding domain-containing protein [Vibrio sp. WXL103]|uniref:LysM-like peptidoglycan-binding domain-containing protein n=1 Tax=unclassified Vibrio TaxID=2614977 RepID=UPI003EC9249E